MRIRYRRRLTPHQEALQKYANLADVRQSIIAAGISDYFRHVDSPKYLEIIRSIIDNDFEPAVKLDERTQADLEASFSRRSKAPIVERSKTRRKDPKPAKAKT
jgi:hypothetical protein